MKRTLLTVLATLGAMSPMMAEESKDKFTLTEEESKSYSLINKKSEEIINTEITTFTLSSKDNTNQLDCKYEEKSLMGGFNGKYLIVKLNGADQLPFLSTRCLGLKPEFNREVENFTSSPITVDVETIEKDNKTQYQIRTVKKEKKVFYTEYEGICGDKNLFIAALIGTQNNSNWTLKILDKDKAQGIQYTAQDSSGRSAGKSIGINKVDVGQFKINYNINLDLNSRVTKYECDGFKTFGGNSPRMQVVLKLPTNYRIVDDDWGVETIEEEGSNDAVKLTISLPKED